MARILLIDDDLSIQRLFELYLAKDGHDIVTAVDGKQGLMLLSGSHFDLVITDLIMPEQDGFEVLTRMRKETDRPKVIVISGGSDRLGKENMLEMAGCLADRALAKPIQRETLLSAVREVLAGSG